MFIGGSYLDQQEPLRHKYRIVYLTTDRPLGHQTTRLDVGHTTDPMGRQTET